MLAARAGLSFTKLPVLRGKPNPRLLQRAHPVLVGQFMVPASDLHDCLALAVASALFLILELDRPFQGIIQISSAPLHKALEQLGQ